MTASLNERLAGGGLELSNDDVKVLTDEANPWLRKDKLSRPKPQAYLLFASTKPPCSGSSANREDCSRRTA